MFKLVRSLDVIAWNDGGVFFLKSNHQHVQLLLLF